MKRIFPLFLMTVLLVSCSKEAVSKPVDVKLKIAISDQNYSSMKKMTDQFHADNPNVIFDYDVRQTDSLNYYLRHEQLDADIVCLEDFKEIELASSQFVDFSTSEYLNRFTKCIRNYIAYSDKGYCLPSPGGFYSYCVNNDLLNRYNLSVPTSFSEMMDMASNINDIVTPFVSSFEGNSSYLDTFMQALIPSYFSNPIGYNTFMDVYHGEDTFKESSSYESLFNSINNSYRNMYVSKFAKAKLGQTDSVNDFFDGDALMMSLTPNFDFEKEFNKAKARFDYSFLPFLGNYNGDSWLPSTANFFLAVTKKIFKGNKLKPLNALLDYFSTMEGQQLLMEDEYGEIQKNRICYLSDASFELQGTYESLNSLLKRGRIYFVDNFLYVFNQVQDSLKEFAEEQINASQLVDDFDDSISLLNNYLVNRIDVPELEGKGDLSYQRKETVNEILKLIQRELKTDMIFLEDSFVKENIFDGSFYENELTFVFDDSINGVLCQMDGKEVLKILSGLDSSYSCYGASQRDNTFMTNDLKPIDENKKYRVMISKKYLDSHQGIKVEEKETLSPFAILKSSWFASR